MVIARGHIESNSVVLDNSTITQYEGKSVTITLDEHNNFPRDREFARKRLEAVRNSITSNWGMDAQTFISSVRADRDVQ